MNASTTQIPVQAAQLYHTNWGHDLAVRAYTHEITIGEKMAAIESTTWMAPKTAPNWLGSTRLVNRDLSEGEEIMLTACKAEAR